MARPPFLDRSSQVAGYLREQIIGGRWLDHLPSERNLAQELGVSRRSLGAALAELSREGLLVSRERVGHAVAHLRPQQAAADSRSIGMVISTHKQPIRGTTLYTLNEMRKAFEARHIQLVFHQVGYLPGKSVGERFKKLIRETNHSGWILTSATEPMQHWCKTHQVTAMVYGMGGIHLPSICLDYRAVCRHAAGSALRQGHRRLSLIMPAEETIEDHASKAGFLEAVETSPYAGIIHDFEHHGNTIPTMCRLADHLLNRNPAPTAWLVRRAGDFFTIFSHLQRRGVRIPEDVSLVCAQSGDHLSDLVPEPTRYEANLKIYAHRCVQLAIRVMEGQDKKACIRIMPDFIRGETLGSA